MLDELLGQQCADSHNKAFGMCELTKLFFSDCISYVRCKLLLYVGLDARFSCFSAPHRPGFLYMPDRWRPFQLTFRFDCAPAHV